MRDFKNGGDMQVGGDLIIADHSETVGKLLRNCTNEELLEEYPYRIENLRQERNRKLKVVEKIICFAVFLFIASSVWAYLNGKSDLVSAILGIGSMVVTCASVNGFTKPNEFEVREKHALDEIKMILKSRRVKLP